MKFDWKKTVATVAPALATAFGGPLAGVAVTIAGKALGLNDATEQDIAEAVATGNPDVLLKLREANNQFIIEMKRLDVDIDRIHAEDRDSARKLGIARGLTAQWSLSAIFVVAFGVVLGMMFSPEHQIPEGMKDTALILFGALVAELAKIMNYWFGSSAGSSRKTDMLAAMEKAP